MAKEKIKKVEERVNTIVKPATENPMREIKIDKVVLSVGGVAEELEKGIKLLEILTAKKPAKVMSRKRIPALGVRPGLHVGALVTIRKKPEETLKRMLTPKENTLKKSQISENNFSFGIAEYIEIPGVEYHRDIGIKGLDVTVVMKRTGRRVRLKKIKRGKIPKRQAISREEIIKFMEENFKTKFI
ncbi:MAG: 50S ribosomal protein L5 [Nanoarchaeota archaeon]|nr:50S ribosomal protein L5 [Nanoarchaeota archaeon]MBU1501155.1 50S ribosomal protein L5 [Nanoarchaeota archaeon]MBU2458835.1 50S ribosomal protein L5 [Nanoarchaeota archaeon]